MYFYGENQATAIPCMNKLDPSFFSRKKAHHTRDLPYIVHAASAPVGIKGENINVELLRKSQNKVIFLLQSFLIVFQAIMYVAIKSHCVTSPALFW